MRQQWPTTDIAGPFRNEYSFLSNFHPAKIRFYNTYFPTAEHAYQAGKAINNEHQFRQIRDADSPTEAKKLGGWADLPSDWKERKLQHMTQVVTAKFSQHPHLRNALLETGDQLIVELNWWGDKYWGADINTGEGKNKLGCILMGLRDLFNKTNPRD